MPKGPKGEKRHADTVQNAMLIGRIATGEIDDTPSKAPNRAKGGKIGVDRDLVLGSPDIKHVSTSFVERQNLTMRMSMRRFTRLTNAFSKKVENHYHALALYFVWYNFVKMHKTLRMTPAMAADLVSSPLEMSDIVKLIDAREAVPAKRGPYKKREKIEKFQTEA